MYSVDLDNNSDRVSKLNNEASLHAYNPKGRDCTANHYDRKVMIVPIVVVLQCYGTWDIAQPGQSGRLINVRSLVRIQVSQLC